MGWHAFFEMCPSLGRILDVADSDINVGMMEGTYYDFQWTSLVCMHWMIPFMSYVEFSSATLDG